MMSDISFYWLFRRLLLENPEVLETLIYNLLEECGEKNTYGYIRYVSEQSSSERCSKTRSASAGQTGYSSAGPT